MEDDHMIETLATNGSNHSLDIGSLPWRARCRQDFANAHVSHLFSEVIAKDPIAVPQQVTRELVKGGCLPQLLSRPLRGRLGSHIDHIEVQNATSVDGDQLLSMILQKCAPSLRRRFAAAHHVFADAALTDVDSELKQLTVDPWCTPVGILSAHLADQISDLTGNDRSSRLAVSHFPGPEKAKALAMPGHDRFGLDEGQCRAPAAPGAGEPDP